MSRWACEGVSANASRVLLLQFLFDSGKLPEWATSFFQVAEIVTGLGEAEVAMACAELEDKGLIVRVDKNADAKQEGSQ